MEFEKESLQWLDYEIFSGYTNVIARTFLRHGGTSVGAFSHLNVSDVVGDHPDSVKVNRSLIQKSLDVENMVFAKQVHGKKITLISKENMFSLKESDGLYTKEKNIALAVSHADCQAAVFFDPIQKIIACVHAGWRSLVLDIYKETINAFLHKGSKISDILVAISPSIGPCHAEFHNYKEIFPKEFWFFREGHLFNLWQIAKKLLTDSGILEKNIEITETCTYDNPKDYYSFRREKITGRHATVVFMK